MRVADIVWNGKNSRVWLSEAAFDNKAETVLKGLEIESGNALPGSGKPGSAGTDSGTRGIESGSSGFRRSVPLIRKKVALDSSDLGQVSVRALLVDDAALQHTKMTAKD